MYLMQHMYYGCIVLYMFVLGIIIVGYTRICTLALALGLKDPLPGMYVRTSIYAMTISL